MNTRLIAPCGMNCGGCLAYLREKNRCDGCRAPNRQCNKNCTIAGCEQLRGRFCGRCDSYPCARLKHLDKRYRAKYGMSMIENLAAIAEVGVRRFVADEKIRWTCPNCGETLCIHRPTCLKCGAKRTVRQY
jgi:hypothetical protein